MLLTLNLIETNPGARINVNRHIRVRRIRQAWSVPEGFPKILFLLWAPFKAIFLCIQLFWQMGCISQRPDFIIVQVSYSERYIPYKDIYFLLESSFHSYSFNWSTCW